MVIDTSNLCRAGQPQQNRYPAAFQPYSGMYRCIPHRGDPWAIKLDAMQCWGHICTSHWQAKHRPRSRQLKEYFH